MNAIIPRTPVSIRVATMSDLPFIDALQKKNGKCVGFLHEAALKGKIEDGHVLIAESDEATERRVAPRRGHEGKCEEAAKQFPPSSPASLRAYVASSLPLGYVISTDRYMKHENVGI